MPPAREVAAHQRVEIILERADLVGGPLLRQGGEGVGRGAGAVIVEGRCVAPERDIDGERDLLDRAHAVEPMGAQVARQIEKLVGREVGGGDALEDLLIGGVGRFRRAAVLADQRLDRRAVDDVERIERAAPGVARIDGRRVDDQHLLDQHPEPVGERMAPVGTGEKAADRVDALRHVRRIRSRPRPHRIALRGDLVLAGLDHRAQERQGVREAAQFRERDAVLGARDIVEVGAERIVELPALDLRRRHRRERLQRPEPGVRRHAGDHVARRVGEAGEYAWGQGPSESVVRHRIGSLAKRAWVRLGRRRAFAFR